MTLAELGWNSEFAAAFTPYAEKGWVPGRLIRETTINFGVVLDGGEEIPAVVAGKLWHDAATDAELPAVGDWAAIEMGRNGADHVIRALLPRHSCFSRKAPGKSVTEQVIAANVDIVAVITDAGADQSLRRMERYFALISRSGAKALVLVNKADLHTKAHMKEAVERIRALWSEADVHAISAQEGTGTKVLRSYLKPGVTMCIVGSSGVGKSTLVNHLYGAEWQWTDEVNEVTGKGRHTTTARELVPVPGGGMVIDNPGIREVQMWVDERTLRESFADIECLTAECRFHDCKHGSDVGCALRAAVDAGQVDGGRLTGFLRLDEEIARLRKLSKKRQMTVERWAKRGKGARARNFNDRVQQEREQRGEWR